MKANTRAVKAERLVFQKVPAFAGFILDNHLEDFASDQLASFRELRVPLLKFIETLPEPALVALSIASSREFLTYLAENRADQQIVDSRIRWETDQMATIDRDQIVADDITLITYARKRSLVDFIPRFTNELGEAIALIRELDAYFLKAETSSIDTYIGLLQEKVRAELHFNEKITQTSPGIIYVFDLAERRQVYSNDKLRDVLGFSSEEIQEMGGEVLFQLMHPADLSRALERIGSLSTLADGEIRTWEYRLKDRQGRYRWMRNYESLFKRNAEGRPQQVIGIAIDIDHAKRAGEELERSQEQLLEAQELAGLGSFVWNLTSHEISVTPQVLKILDLARTGDMKGFMEKVHPQDREKVQKAIDTAVQNHSLYECEYRLLTSRGEKVIWSRGSISQEDDRLIMKGTIQDVTSSKRAERQILAKSEELQSINLELQNFASVASHDLREPLRKIILFAGLLEKDRQGDFGEKGRMYMDKITDAADRMQQLIDDILEFSRLRSEDLAFEKTDLNALVAGVLSDIEVVVASTGARVETGPLPGLEANPTQIRQLFQNLISNAIKFRHPDRPPHIRIFAEMVEQSSALPPENDRALPYDSFRQISRTGSPEPERMHRIYIQDNGIGFDEADLEKMFQLFQRLHGRSEFEGTGLGLAISKRVVENHRGTITATSRPGEGSTFVVTLPAEQG